MEGRLTRYLECTHGTFGILAIGPQRFHALEEENQLNRRNISSIPAGDYVCKRTIYQRYRYDTFEVTDVPNRTRILFHSGNTEEDTMGCIILGMDLGPLAVEDEDTEVTGLKLAVLASRKAFRSFMETLEGIDEFELVITAPEI